MSERDPWWVFYYLWRAARASLAPCPPWGAMAAASEIEEREEWRLHRDGWAVEGWEQEKA